MCAKLGSTHAGWHGRSFTSNVKLQEYVKVNLAHLDFQERLYVHSKTAGVFRVSFNTSRTAW